MTVDARTALSERIRPLLPDAEIREVTMFGARCFMVDGAMAVAAHRDGSLLVRVDRATDAEQLARPHASRPEMGAGRSMGSGWIRVDAAGLDDDADLAGWIRTAVTRDGNR